MKIRQKKPQQLTQDFLSHCSCRRTAFITFLQMGINFISDYDNPGFRLYLFLEPVCNAQTSPAAG